MIYAQYHIGLLARALMPWGTGRTAERVAELGAMVGECPWEDELVLWWRQLVYHDAPPSTWANEGWQPDLRREWAAA